MSRLPKTDIQSMLQQASRCVASHNKEEAQKILQAIESDQVTDASTHTAIGRLYAGLGAHALAITWYLRAVQIAPDDNAALTALGISYAASQQYANAGVTLTKALSGKPDNLEAIAAMGFLLFSRKDFSGAVAWLEKAVALKTTDTAVYNNLSLASAALGLSEKALKYAEQARRLNPKSPYVLHTLAKALIGMGRMEEAQRHLLKAIQYDPASGIAYEYLAKAKQFTQKDLPLIQQCEELLQVGMPVTERYSALFALGKMYDDIGEYQKAFKYYQQGNMLAKPIERPLVDRDIFKFEKTICTSSRLMEAQNIGHRSTTPVFVVGMPRSGTSLVEQIIASHPMASGAGELTEIHRIADVLCVASKKKKLIFGDRFEMPGRDMWQQQAEEYLAVLCAGREHALRVTDKLPENFNFLGIIAMMFPEARIIHVVRHPLDVCLSCYFQLFMGVQWSTDLHWIADTYREYRNTIEYWKKTLPQGKIVDVHYERLVSEPDIESRRLIDSCGLEWDSACLDFFNNGRGVQTASAWQVRQPMYQSSKMRWIKYAPYIGQLANALSDYLQDDIEILKEHGIQIKRK